MSVLKSSRAPKPIGPYVLGREVSGICHFSGQIALDPVSGNMVQDSFQNEVDQVFLNMKNMLEDNGLTFQNVIKTTVFLTDMADFSAFNEVYAKNFSDPYPARSCVAVKALPKGARVEVEVIASR